MKTSLLWLRNLVPSLEASDDAIVAALTHSGFEVRSVTVLDGDLDAVSPLEGELPEEGSLEEALPAAFDTIVELEDADRFDVLGHVGMAREVAALFRIPFIPPGVDAPVRVAEKTVESFADVDVLEPERCAHYGLLVVDDVTVEPSPLWLRVRLHALGIAPRNNVEDLACLVMVESGHPVAVFDLDCTKGPLAVRLVEEGETMVIDDDREVRLVPTDLVVADAQGPIALAGIATAKRVRPSSSTRKVLFDCGCYAPDAIRATADRLELVTEPARRHGLGSDRNDTAEVLAQAGALATRLAKGAAVPGSIHVFEEPWQAQQVVVEGAQMQHPPQLAKDALEHVGFEVVLLHGDGLQVSVPSFRTDIADAGDVVREVSRIVAAWSRTTV